MKTETPIRQLYAEHYKINSNLPLDCHGFRYEVHWFNPNANTLNNERGHYILATIYFKNLIVGIIYVDNEDGVFNSYRLELNSCFNLTLSSINSSNVFGKRETYNPKHNHETVQSCIDELEKIRSYIVDFFVV